MAKEFWIQSGKNEKKGKGIKKSEIFGVLLKMTYLKLPLPQDWKNYDFKQESTTKQKVMSHWSAQDSWSWSFLQAAHIVSIKNNTGNLHKRSAYVCVSHCFT